MIGSRTFEATIFCLVGGLRADGKDHNEPASGRGHGWGYGFRLSGL